jgi:hypothetical protein
MSARHRADEIADTLRDAGLTVERVDYPALADGTDIGERHYAIVRARDGQVEVQTNGRIPQGSVGSYSGPGGDALAARVRTILNLT